MTEGNDRKIRENEAEMEEVKRAINASSDAIAAIGNKIATLREDLGRAQTLKASLAANLRYRAEQKDIASINEEIDGMDLRAAAIMRRDFNSKYNDMLNQEMETQNKWSTARGEVTQMTKNRQHLEEVLKADYTGIDQKYKMQLIKTKVGSNPENDAANRRSRRPPTMTWTSMVRLSTSECNLP
jgi:DNA repair protein RAD50